MTRPADHRRRRAKAAKAIAAAATVIAAAIAAIARNAGAAGRRTPECSERCTAARRAWRPSSTSRISLRPNAAPDAPAPSHRAIEPERAPAPIGAKTR